MGRYHVRYAEKSQVFWWGDNLHISPYILTFNFHPIAAQMNLRKAKITDLKTIISWIPNEPTCKRWAGPKVRFPFSIESLSKDIDFSDSNSYCLVKSESIFGFGQLLTKKEGYLHLARIIVDPSKRKMGYGKLLCNELLQIAYQKGYHKISLNVYRNNRSALKLYKNIGFHEIAEKSSQENCHMIAGV